MVTIEKVQNNGECGAALVEFALVVPLFLLLLFGIIEFSIMLYDNAVITNASREAAREWVEFVEIVDKPSCQVLKTVVDNYAQNMLYSFGPTSSDPQIALWKSTQLNPPSFSLIKDFGQVCSSVALSYDSGNLLKIAVKWDYDYLFLPGMVEGLAPTLTLKAETVMRAE